jgi:hypothetical protein
MNRPTFLRASAIASAITLAFAAPATARVLHGAASSETRLGEAIASAFGGITFPVVGAAIAATLFARESAPRRRMDRLVAAGAEPNHTALPRIGIALGGAAAGAALAGIVVVVLLRAIVHLPALLVVDALGTAWANALGASAWTALAIALVIGSGRAGRAYVVIGIDLATRLLPGAVAWIAPSAHVGNVLGAPPPRGFVHVPVLPQLVSVAFLVVLAAIFAALATRTYRGVPRS